MPKSKRSQLIEPPAILPEVTVTLPFRLESDPHWNRGTMTWKVEDSVVKVSDPETGDHLGDVCACFGGFLEVHRNGQVWRLDPRNVWYAVTEAIANAEGRP